MCCDPYSSFAVFAACPAGLWLVPALFAALDPESIGSAVHWLTFYGPFPVRTPRHHHFDGEGLAIAAFMFRPVVSLILVFLAVVAAVASVHHQRLERFRTGKHPTC